MPEASSVICCLECVRTFAGFGRSFLGESSVSFLLTVDTLVSGARLSAADRGAPQGDRNSDYARPVEK
jgi:hypothetical protein